MWHSIVIGSGLGGLAAAAALGRRGHRVLVLEQHATPGGLAQRFTRGRWQFCGGIHHLGAIGPQPGPSGSFGRLLDWLTEGRLQMVDCGNPYDMVRLPGLDFGVEHPESAFRAALEARFPADHDGIAQWFGELHAARRAAASWLAMRGLPAGLAWGLRRWRGAEVERWSRRTVAEALAPIAQSQLRALLGGRWADHGAPPAEAPLLEHALATGAFESGACYPVGGPAQFVQALLPAVQAAGGELRLQAEVRGIVVEGGRACGVRVSRADGSDWVERAVHVVSAMGVGNTVARLPADAAADWQGTLRQLRPGLPAVQLFLGFDGDLAAAGATAANWWIYESDDVGRVWQRPAEEDAPALFVAFPSVRDARHGGAATAEIVAPCDAQAFARWQGQAAARQRPGDYLAFKAAVTERLVAQFARHFPGLMPLLRFRELATPLSRQYYVRTPEGAMYGIEMSAQRLTEPALRVRTPLPGLYLAGQDVAVPGVQGSFMGGWMAAAAIDTSLLRLMAV